MRKHIKRRKAALDKVFTPVARWGARCKDYYEGCATCEYWRLRDKMNKFPSALLVGMVVEQKNHMYTPTFKELS